MKYLIVYDQKYGLPNEEKDSISEVNNTIMRLNYDCEVYKIKRPHDEVKIKGEYYSVCCDSNIYGKGMSKGIFCSKCNREIFETKHKTK